MSAGGGGSLSTTTAGGGGSLSTTTAGGAVVGGAGGAVGAELKQMTFKCAAIAKLHEGAIKAIPELSANSTNPYAYDIAYKVYGLMYGGFHLQQILAGTTPPPIISKNDRRFLNTFLIDGFPEVNNNDFKASEYLLAAVTCGEEILSTCILIEKTKGSSKVLEIWSLTTNPFFLKTGAAAFLIYNIINLSINKGCAHIFLEVARDSFPFISFYERFLLYARYGFDTPNVPPTIVSVITNESQKATLDLSTCMFVSDIHKYDWYKEKTAVIQQEGGTYTPSSIEDFKTKYPLMYPTNDAVRMFLTPANIDTNKLGAKITSLSKPMLISPIPIYVPRYRSAFLSHSGYQIDRSGVTEVLKTAVLPSKVELIIFNTPGYSVSYQEIAANWRFNQAYLSHLPIELLKKYFPGFKFPINVPLEAKDMVDFVKKTSGSIEFDYEYRAKEASRYRRHSNAQIHCYSAGDTYPDLAMSSKLGTDASDWTSCMFGIHTLPKGDIGYVLNDIVPYPRHGSRKDKEKWASERGVLITTSNRHTIYLNLHHGLPLQKDTNLFFMPIGPGNTLHNLNLSDAIAQVLERITGRNDPKEPPLTPKESMIRIAMFACGNTESNGLDLILQQASKFRLGEHVPVESADKYSQMLKLLGESLITAVGAVVGGEDAAIAAAAVGRGAAAAAVGAVGGEAAAVGGGATAAVGGGATAAAVGGEAAELDKRIKFFDDIYDIRYTAEGYEEVNTGGGGATSGGGGATSAFAASGGGGATTTTTFAASGGGGATDSTLGNSTLGKGSKAAEVIKHLHDPPVERKAVGAAGAGAVKNATSTAAATERAEWAADEPPNNVNALSSSFERLKVTMSAEDAAALGVSKKSWSPNLAAKASSGGGGGAAATTAATTTTATTSNPRRSSRKTRARKNRKNRTKKRRY